MRNSKLNGNAIKVIGAALSVALIGWGLPARAELPRWPLLPPPLEHSCGPSEETTWVWLPQANAASILSLLERWQQHPLAPLSGCLQPRYYHHAHALRCEAQGERQHLRCDLPLLPRELNQRHIVFIETETASASAQQMVLSPSSPMTLFAHEMAHWLGFADEYPMSRSLAQAYCNGRYTHPSLNVVLTRKQVVSTYELKQLWQRLPWRDAVEDWRQLGQQQANGDWRLGSVANEEVGLFAAQTCASIAGVYSWKPVAKLTAMEYHDVNYWPAVYLKTARDLQRRRSLRDHDDWAE